MLKECLGGGGEQACGSSPGFRFLVAGRLPNLNFFGAELYVSCVGAGRLAGRRGGGGQGSSTGGGAAGRCGESGVLGRFGAGLPGSCAGRFGERSVSAGRGASRSGCSVGVGGRSCGSCGPRRCLQLRSGPATRVCRRRSRTARMSHWQIECMSGVIPRVTEYCPLQCNITLNNPE